MTVGINIHGGGGATGGGGTGGGGAPPGGGGKGGRKGGGYGGSQLFRLLLGYVNNPNPATLQILSETFSNVFPGDPIFSRSEKTKNKQINNLHKSMERAAHKLAIRASKSGWDTSESTHRKLIAQSAELANAHGYVQRIIGGATNERVATAHNALSSSIRSLGTLGTSGEVSVLRSLSMKGRGAALSGNHRELKKIERTLEKSERNSTQMLAAIKTGHGVTPSASQQEQQAHHRRIIQAAQAGRAGIAQARMMGPAYKSKTGFGALGDAAAGYMAAVAPYAAAAGVVLGAPVVIPKAAAAAWNLAKPYTDLRRGLARKGRYAGFNSRAVYDAIKPKWITAPGWMSRAGITVSDVPGILGAYGAGTGNSNQTLRMLHAVAAGKLMSGLGGSSVNTIAGVLGQKSVLGIGGGNKAYETQFARIMTYAVSKGMDGATVMSDMRRNLHTIAAAGGIAAVSPLRRLMGKWYAGGSPAMRQGSGALTMMGAMASLSGNITRTPIDAMMFLQEAQRHGGGLTSMAGAKEMFKYYGIPMPKDKAQMNQLRLGIASFKAGDTIFGMRYIAPLFATAMEKMAHGFSQRIYGKKGGPLMEAALLQLKNISLVFGANAGKGTVLPNGVKVSGANVPHNIFKTMSDLSSALVGSGHYVKHFGDSVDRFGEAVDRFSGQPNTVHHSNDAIYHWQAAQRGHTTYLYYTHGHTTYLQH
ncbi:MAG: hypothetical protein ACYCOU_10725 [Sulfobacillus sp.]